MYTPSFFAVEDRSALDQLFAHDGFITLVHQHEGVPSASHLPVLYRREDDSVRLFGHWARANPQWREAADQRVLVMVHGPHAYVSPTWYQDPEQRVPTWNYAVAHLTGRLRVFDDRQDLAALVSELAARYESKNGSNWSFTTDAQRAGLAAIVGFEFVAESISVKYKLSQNHPRANRLGVIAGLRASGGADAGAVADWMQQTLESP